MSRMLGYADPLIGFWKVVDIIGVHLLWITRRFFEGSALDTHLYEHPAHRALEFR